MRRSLGFKLLDANNGLIQFASFLEQSRATHITIALAMKWAQQDKNARPPEWARRLSFVRGFARHWSAHDSRTEVPPRVAALPAWAGPPVLIQRRRDPETAPGRPSVAFRARSAGSDLYCLLGLLTVAGLRISEARNLRTEDVDLNEGILTIRGRSLASLVSYPFIPRPAKCSPTMRPERIVFWRDNRTTFFVSGRGTRLDGAEIRRTFYTLSRQVGLRGPSDSHGPRLHDFRHRFAVETLVQWYRAGQDVERRLPALSTYLGHVHVADTYWYLSAFPS